MSYPKLPADQTEGLTAQQSRQAELAHSVIGRFGQFIEPAIRPLGFDWKIGTALIGATAAKEVFVSQLGIVYAVSGGEVQEQTLREQLQANYTPLVGFCICLFCLVYAPCVVTVIMTRQETGRWGWAVTQFLGLTTIAYVLTLVVYQIGKLFIG
jgi:ferrous iron transport protein B